MTPSNNYMPILGWDKEISGQRIFDLVRQAVGWPLAPEYTPFRPWEAMHIALRTGRARRLLGWQPAIDLTEGVRRTLAAIT